MLPPASLVTVRIPGAENAPKPLEGEVVVFNEHFYRGFGLPVSTFFNNVLIFFDLQPHHLAPNAILQLASFLVVCGGVLGMEPCLDLWQSLFFFKQQSKKIDKAEVEKLDGPHPMTPCGAALMHHRMKCGFP
ncbi:retrotransposon ty3-gypsy subclass [Hordeum vulgare]|nr:retrotransposon ty3-gypsy subclass [Hordeum vulgare]